jgi:hypothetical protein
MTPLRLESQLARCQRNERVCVLLAPMSCWRRCKADVLSEVAVRKRLAVGKRQRHELGRVDGVAPSRGQQRADGQGRGRRQ